MKLWKSLTAVGASVLAVSSGAILATSCAKGPDFAQSFVDAFTAAKDANYQGVLESTLAKAIADGMIPGCTKAKTDWQELVDGNSSTKTNIQVVKKDKEYKYTAAGVDTTAVYNTDKYMSFTTSALTVWFWKDGNSFLVYQKSSVTSLLSYHFLNR